MVNNVHFLMFTNENGIISLNSTQKRGVFVNALANMGNAAKIAVKGKCCFYFK